MPSHDAFKIVSFFPPQFDYLLRRDYKSPLNVFLPTVLPAETSLKLHGAGSEGRVLFL